MNEKNIFKIPTPSCPEELYISHWWAIFTFFRITVILHYVNETPFWVTLIKLFYTIHSCLTVEQWITQWVKPEHPLQFLFFTYYNSWLQLNYLLMWSNVDSYLKTLIKTEFPEKLIQIGRKAFDSLCCARFHRKARPKYIEKKSLLRVIGMCNLKCKLIPVIEKCSNCKLQL